MSAESSTANADSSDIDSRGEYVVVARRYRPQSFGDLVGQQQVSQALSNAITTNRVGHAYLFTGARGVGKTSTARILGKCLNCVSGPTPEPCGKCDACSGIAVGDDVDVIEIDGASNRGIDEIRQLRSNVNVRPSRSRFKIYIIDEVHMLTVPAFNALLKTLEEPPDHVKFMFCTTDPEKIPVTVLSRCQRFDFAPVDTDSILDRLRFIVESEGVEADEAALRQLARRAAGSMRDSQSLLEQLLSFCGERISEDDVHAMLGTAQGGRLSSIAERLLARDAAGSLSELDAAVRDGVDVGQLAEQLLGYFRDMMAASAGCDADMMLHTATADHARLKKAAEESGLEEILAIVQILDHAVARMRQSTHVRTLVEMALVRISNLEDLAAIPALIAQLTDNSGSSGGRPANTGVSGASASGPPRRAQKKTPVTAEVASDSPAPKPAVSAKPQTPKEQPELTAEFVEQSWRQALAEIGGMVEDFGGDYEAVAISAPNLLVVTLRAAYNKEYCERSDVKRKLQEVMSRLTGRDLQMDFAVTSDTQSGGREQRQPAQSRRQRILEVQKHPLIQEAIRLFDADVTGLEEKRKA